MIETLTSNLLIVLAQTGNNAGQPSGSNWMVLWAILLLGTALALFFVEIFLPSGGLIAIGSALCLIVGIVLLFQVNTWYGLIGATVALLSLPFAIGFALKLFPETPIARALTLRSDHDEELESATEQEQTMTGAASVTAKAVPDAAPSVGDTGRTVRLASAGRHVRHQRQA